MDERLPHCRQEYEEHGNEKRKAELHENDENGRDKSERENPKEKW